MSASLLSRVGGAGVCVWLLTFEATAPRAGQTPAVALRTDLELGDIERLDESDGAALALQEGTLWVLHLNTLTTEELPKYYSKTHGRDVGGSLNTVFPDASGVWSRVLSYTGDGNVIDYESDVLVSDSVQFLPLSVAPDIDADGLADGCAGSTYLLSRIDGLWEAHRYPGYPEDSTWPDHHSCLPDLNGDGHGDLLVQDYDLGLFGGPMSLHLGGPQGYSETALWTETLFTQAIVDAIAVQRDQDPELELAITGNQLAWYGTQTDESVIFIVDDVLTNPRVVEIFRAWPDGNPRGMTGLVAVGDLDGDGIDEFGIPEVYGERYFPLPEDFPHVRVLSSAAAKYPIEPPVATFRFDVTSEEQGSEMVVDAADLNHDGHMDLFGFIEVDGGSLVQVWYGPLYEPPEPEETGETGATGDTGDTGGPTDTGAGTDSASDTGAPPKPTIDGAGKGGCGCASARWPSMAGLLTRRRADRPGSRAKAPDGADSPDGRRGVR